jgi:hypothetical protein
LVDKVKEHTGYEDLETLFGWEIAHREDRHRKRRKIQQLIVDEITFVFSGVIALAAFWFLVPKPPIGVTILSDWEIERFWKILHQVWLESDPLELNQIHGQCSLQFAQCPE